MTEEALAPTPEEIRYDALRRVAVANARLKASGDPMGLLSGEAKPLDADDLPTPEWMAKHRGEFQAPEQSQTVNRSVYARLHQLESLYEKGVIEYPLYMAGKRMRRHWEGAQGVNVTEGEASSPADLHREESGVYHAQKLDEAKKTLSWKEWKPIEALISEHYPRAFLDRIGQDILGYRTPAQARAAATERIKSGLERLEVHFDRGDKK